MGRLCSAALGRNQISSEVPALPPDVRRGFAPPVSCSLKLASPLLSGFVLSSLLRSMLGSPSHWSWRVIRCSRGKARTRGRSPKVKAANRRGIAIDTSGGKAVGKRPLKGQQVRLTVDTQESCSNEKQEAGLLLRRLHRQERHEAGAVDMSRPRKNMQRSCSHRFS